MTPVFGSQSADARAAGAGDRVCRVLVTDLDGTLLGGSAAARGRLRAVLAAHPEITVVFATGRGLSSVQDILRRDPLVPGPRWIIGDVGASVVDTTDMSHLDVLEERLRAGWPGTSPVRAALDRFPQLVFQSGVQQEGRCSYYLRPEHLAREITDVVAQLGCRWTYSAGRYFDVLPSGASKGNALELLARKLRWPMTSVLVAGDSLNDLSLFLLGAHGVIVGNAEPALRARVPELPAVRRPESVGAEAIVETVCDLGWMERPRPVVIGYHRPPVRWAGGSWGQPSSPNGILPTLRSVLDPAVPGSGAALDAVWATALAGDTNPDPAGHETGLPLAFLPIAAGQWAGYFHRACKETLWPVLMSQPDRMRFDPSAWADYETVNTAFADHISAHAGQGATVWLHDYNLWLVPARLHAMRPDLRVGLFHHTPFPIPSIFARLPVARQIRTSLACLDWAGFHTDAFADNFHDALAGAPRIPATGVHPLGIDRAAVETLARNRTALLSGPEPRSGIEDGSSEMLVLCVERLDYAKAPVQKIHALRRLFDQHPQLRGRLRLRLICPPPEPGLRAYDTTRTQLETAITELNTAHATPGWQPVQYIPRSLPFTDLIDHYIAADVFWVTSLADGMNLTAKEYIATQHATGRHGTLVLSRYAGAATQLAPAAVLTDPHSPHDLTCDLHQALTMPAAERHARMTHLARLLGDHSPTQWAQQILTSIRIAGGAPS
ncbi:HAD-IIB family hydrolase [Streptomyces enissocaesilis]|uniref:Glucosylglycerol-phosphate synthase n=1 Tax=Streptomyces enissocaesilis TaxID=332589 RepID=A0ABN3X761_9ACTN